MQCSKNPEGLIHLTRLSICSAAASEGAGHLPGEKGALLGNGTTDLLWHGMNHLQNPLAGWCSEAEPCLLRCNPTCAHGIHNSICLLKHEGEDRKSALFLIQKPAASTEALLLTAGLIWGCCLCGSLKNFAHNSFQYFILLWKNSLLPPQDILRY